MTSQHCNMREIESQEDFDDVVNTPGKLVVIEFGAQWCGPCKMITPHFIKLAEALKDKVVCAKTDVDDVADLAEDLNIEVMPTFLFYRNGEKVEELKGANRDKLESRVNELI